VQSATSRAPSKNTIVKLLEDEGEAFSDYQDRTMRNLTCKLLQVDEIWAFVYAKAKRAPNGPNSEGRSSRCGRHLDVDGDRRGHEADPVLSYREGR